MKIALIYGFGIALAGAVLTLAAYFLGYHSDPDRIGTGQTIASVLGLAITVIGLVMGIRARRAEVPPTENFGYGRALGTGVMISIFSGIFGAIFLFVYASFINPDYQDVVVDSQIAKMEQQGIPPSQIDQAEGIMRTMSSPAMQAVFAVIMGALIGLVLSLIIAAFLKRPATAEPPPLV